MSRGTLVAGVGNIFLADDGFGVEVAKRLRSHELPPGVRVEDFGIRGVHLAYELLNGYDRLILIDAMPQGGQPGTIYVMEPDLADLPAGTVTDAHGMDPESVIAMLKSLGGEIGRVLIVGCEPVEVVERIGLSEVVAGALEEASRVVLELINEESAINPQTAKEA